MRPPSIPTTIPINRDDSKQLVIMKTLYNSLIEYREPKTHRILIQVFMCLPSRKEFPEYFDIIRKPIAMNKIRERIDRQLYPDEESCIEDFKLMFNNCKFFNENESQIYKDAVCLENILLKRKEQLHIEHSRPSRDSKEAAKEAILNTLNNSSSTTAAAPTTNVTTNSTNITTTTSATTTNIKANTTTNTTNTTTNNSIAASKDTDSQQSDSTSNGKQNGTDDSNNSTKINHNHHNDTSMDSSSNLSADLIASTPVEKCSLNTRRGKNSDVPKRQLLTGYIIYASEIRKQVIDRNPNQNFGDISRLVGNEWKALPHDIRSKYDQRALIHNKRVRERAQRNSLATPCVPKLSKRKLVHLSLPKEDNSSISTPRVGPDTSTVTPRTITTAESSTQTNPLRFVEPPNKKRLSYSETFRKYMESLQVPNLEPARPVEVPTHWLGAGHGRHESPEAALWALREFMLQDSVTMRRSMEPYLFYDKL